MSDHITPIDIVHLRFQRRFRGYATPEVDAFLRDIASDLETVLTENSEQRERIASLERELKQYRTLETTMRDALVLAQKAADETRSASRTQADACVHDAQIRARELESAARDKLLDIQNRIEMARQEHRHVVGVLRSRLTSQLAWLGDEEADLLETSAPRPEALQAATDSERPQLSAASDPDEAEATDQAEEPDEAEETAETC